jgi:hypothetical protein
MSEHKFLLRVPSELWEEVSGAAKRNRRSVNSEIVLALQEEFGVLSSGSYDVGRAAELQAKRNEGLSRVMRESVRPDFKGGKR